MISKEVFRKAIVTIKRHLAEDEESKPNEINEIKEQLTRLVKILKRVKVGTSVHAIATLTCVLALETEKPKAYILSTLVYLAKVWAELEKAGIL